MSDIQKIIVPDVGGDEVEVIELCVAVGDNIEADEGVVTVESDKASMDIPAPFEGEIVSLSVSVGDKIKEGDVIGEMKAAGGGSSDESSAEESSSDDASQEDAPKQEEAPKEESKSDSAPAASGTSEVIEVAVPDIGSDDEVDVIDVLVSVGDTIEKEDGLITLETDKATMDVPSTHAGTVKEVLISNGDKVKEGTVVIKLEIAGEGGSSESSSSASSSTEKAEKSEASSNEASSQQESAPKAEASSETIEVAVPDIGEDGEVDVIDVLVSAGDTVEKEDGLITLETDKATMDVPSTHAGTIKEVFIKTGDKVKQGTLVVKLETSGGETSAPASEKPAEAPKQEAPKKEASKQSSQQAESQNRSPVPPAPEAKSTGKAHASPSVRRVAREFGVDLTQVKGSGPKNRILKEDVQAYVKAELAKPKTAAASGNAPAGDNVLQIVPVKTVDHSKFGEIEEQKLSRIQKISGPFLHRNWATIPHVTQFDEADITDVEDFRKEQNAYHAKIKSGLKITPLVFVMKAVAKALEKYEVFNSSLSDDGESLIIKKFINIGIAVETPGGLVVPVIRDVNKKGIEELSRELIETSKKAREGKLKAADMQGGTFTISSLGGIGGTAFTPIVNAPEVAILGVSKSEMKPKWNGKEFEPRLMVPLSLSYDHRVIDGAVGARFSTEVAANLTDLRRIIL
ncbi:pyruvate dehydrogenase complex dihydrolipoyllysine-residue acetyltransferase [Alteromonas mediterranea]|uniref:Acetyltransferase component of pyruvate dehydrogenase complex n=1 Tax=Alteromonas mediterranea TaxID=314275 RepID=A0AAC9ADP4_9ALTE|nr:pyruvate dehydrogenase complex dihydrolipoyllysine-residue acetyltransferase [Alteromonas mediterranea]AFV86493.1 pyruvate dehydrogenase complex dihydrolipoamide acetyltransferase [Alteromonas mediterranea DE1]AGP98504.1 pyruvate dehydrogenase complex dihydrolipoamide acetyltransferase [Alteromonas mediterranea UM7]AGQ02722.1 pyruvate dehydrogenase complex dihydrolipoamide acetyltransferase [Alteromonas mediterranea UM4b]AMJ79464.1 pyruvate dehydrogenase complex dihydrolipoyllysine-residue a